MVVIPFAVLWFGYQEVIYGWVLMRGWNVSWKELANPFSGYQWPLPPKQPPLIPPTQVYPTGSSSVTSLAAARRRTGRPSTLVQ